MNLHPRGLPPVEWLSRGLRGSCRKENTPAEQVEAGATVHLPLDPLEPSDLPLRLAAATCAAVGSCSTRATRAASGPDSAAGGWTSSQASCEGDGNAGAPPFGADIGVWADALVRHGCGVLGAGAVRCSATQRCTCFAVPGKPAARNSRQRASAFSQP